MRWIAKSKDNLGNKRTIKRFLIFPREINGEVRWLEIQKIEQELRLIPRYEDGYIHAVSSWEDNKFLN